MEKNYVITASAIATLQSASQAPVHLVPGLIAAVLNSVRELPEPTVKE